MDTNPVVILDMDGVILVGSETDTDVYRQATLSAIDNLGVSDPPAEHLEILLTSHNIPLIIQACKNLEIDPHAYWEQREAIASELTNSNVERGLRHIYSDVQEIQDKSDNIDIGIVSNNRQKTISFIADYVFNNKVVVAVGRDPSLEGLNKRKPEPDLILEGLSKISDHDFDDVYYVGDKEKDIIAANRANVHSIYLRRPHNFDKELSIEPDYFLRSLSEIESILV